MINYYYSDPELNLMLLCDQIEMDPKNWIQSIPNTIQTATVEHQFWMRTIVEVSLANHDSKLNRLIISHQETSTIKNSTKIYLKFSKNMQRTPKWDWNFKISIYGICKFAAQLYYKTGTKVAWICSKNLTLNIHQKQIMNIKDYRYFSHTKNIFSHTKIIYLTYPSIILYTTNTCMHTYFAKYPSKEIIMSCEVLHQSFWQRVWIEKLVRCIFKKSTIGVKWRFHQFRHKLSENSASIDSSLVQASEVHQLDLQSLPEVWL